ncbi:hypothetical protein BKA56DRAFT_575170 [Ilyonectria sp. MPI-CAGE-AT-0026]|nr:hypothetical protein BKA56DRAFT_575170 [Ilyonectria sp. MPI-CAGE-AT-0026]
MRNCQGAHYGSTVASDCLQKPAKKLKGRYLLRRELLGSRVQSDRLLLQKVAVWGWLSRATLLFEKHPDAQKRRSRTLGRGALRPPFVMLVRSSSARAPSHEREQPKSGRVGRCTSAWGCRSRGGLVGWNAGGQSWYRVHITAITFQNCWAWRPASARPLASYEPPVRPLPVRSPGSIATFLPVHWLSQMQSRCMQGHCRVSGYRRNEKYDHLRVRVPCRRALRHLQTAVAIAGHRHHMSVAVNRCWLCSHDDDT